MAVSLDVSQLLMAMFAGLVSMVVYNFRNELSRIERLATDDKRVEALEDGQKQVIASIAGLSAEVSRWIGDLKLQLVERHPTRNDLADALESQSRRLSQIETDVRQIAQTLSDRYQPARASRSRT